MLLLIEYILLALSATTRAQQPNSAPPAPSGPTISNGPTVSDSCGPTPPGVPLITIGGHSTVDGDGYTFVGGETLAPEPDGAYIIGQMTLERGSQIVVSSTTYSLGGAGKKFVVDGQTSTITEGEGGDLPDFNLPIPNSCDPTSTSSRNAGSTTTRAASAKTTSIATTPKTSNFPAGDSSSSTTSAALASAATSAAVTTGTVGVPASSAGSSVSSAYSSTPSTGTSDTVTLQQGGFGGIAQSAVVASMGLLLVAALML